MQPCSQPRYGLTVLSNGTESVFEQRQMNERVSSSRYSTRRVASTRSLSAASRAIPTSAGRGAIADAFAFGGGGGGHDGKFEGFVARAGRGSASDEDRAMFAAFLESDAAVIRHEVRKLRDAWYGGLTG